MNTIDYYIDIHSHILPGVDDGARNMDETIHMLQIAIQQGIRSMIATPHYAAGRNNLPVEELQKVKNRVQEEAVKLHKDFQLYLGNELFYSESIVDCLKSKEALTLAGSRYVLVEFQIHTDYQYIYKGLGNLIRAGYLPILAHMERYHCLVRKRDRIMELIEMGCYIQMNSNSLIGGLFNTEASYNRKLLSYGLVHFIGSDCHDKEFRIPKMKTTVDILRKKYDERLIQQIVTDNPSKLLIDTYL